MGLRRIPFALRALLAPLSMAAWIACMFLTALLLEEVHYRRRVYACFQGHAPTLTIRSSTPVPAFLRKTATQLRMRPNRKVWCGRTPEDAFDPGDHRFSAVQYRASMAPSCFVGWLGIVPTAVPYRWLKELPFSEAYESLEEPVNAWDRYNDEVERASFRACKANEHTRGTRMTNLRVRGEDGEMVDKLTEVPADTWYAEVTPETLEHFIGQLERFADRFEAAMERYEPQHNYLLYLSIPVVLAWLLLGAFMALLFAITVQDVQHRLLGVDDESWRARLLTLSALGEPSAGRLADVLKAKAERAAKRRDLATAIAAYRLAIVKAPRDDLLDALAALQMRRGGPNDAQDAALLYVQMSKQVPLERARSLLKRALECDPQCEEAARVLRLLVGRVERGRP